jgi:phage terminase large subunit
VDKIQKFGLGSSFDALETEIRGKNGSLIIFRGMQSYNAENIKSLENFDIAWVEEAQTLSEKSLRLLRPTIRVDGSELWFGWNPRHDTDAVDSFFRGEARHPRAISVPVNWDDNPWFPDVLREEKDADYAIDAEMAEHVWGGGYEIITEGAYYARLIAEAEKAGRVGYFPYDPRYPVKTAWDIGVDDYTAIWFIQDDGVNVWVIDYYEATGFGAEEIVREGLPECLPDLQERVEGLQSLGRDKAFEYGEHFVPHDARVREWGAGARPRSLTLMQLGVKPLRIGAATNPADRVNAVRRILPITRFNQTKRVMLGLSRLRRYSRKFNDALGTYTTPLHDINSHGSDAFGEFAVNCPIIPPKPVLPTPRKPAKGQVYLPGAPEPSRSNRIRI